MIVVSVLTAYNDYTMAFGYNVNTADNRQDIACIWVRIYIRHNISVFNIHFLDNL